MATELKSQLLTALKSFSQQQVLVVGDLMLDEYHWCTVDRLSPEAPVPVCRVSNTTLAAGGAANVAVNVRGVESSVWLSGHLGSDSTGDKLMTLLHEQKINTDLLIRNADKPSTLKSRIVAHQQHVVRVDREEVFPLSKELEIKILTGIEEILPQMGVVLLSDYLKGTLTPSLISGVISLCKRYKKIVVVDPKGDDVHKYLGATLLTPNFKEFEIITQRRIKSEEEILSLGLEIIKTCQLEALLITRSEKGMSLITESGKKIDIPTKARDVYDITGAGDTVISTLSIALAAGLSFEISANLANYAASVVVGKIGTSFANISEIRTAILSDERLPSSEF